ncbi:hypothetical protein V1505DRAFT_402047 [Lipomyces doorenjongii]
MGKPKVLIISDITEENPLYANHFSQKFECIRYRPTTKEQYFEDIKSDKLQDINAVLVMWYAFIELGATLDKDIIEALPQTVQVFAFASVGHDRYDVDQFTRKKIILTNNRGLGSVQVAEIAMHLMLSTFRFTSALEHTLRKYNHLNKARGAARLEVFAEACPNDCVVDAAALRRYEFGSEIGGRQALSPFGKRCGILGLGAIGREIAIRAAAFGMSIHYYTRTPLTKDVLSQLPAHKMTAYPSVDELLPNCDVLILAIPLSTETKHIINAHSLYLLPQGARIVNIGRGALIDTAALLAALDDGHISAAGFDVYECEPDLPDGFADRWDITVLPHIGYATADALTEAENGVMRNIEDVLDGGCGITPINKIE